MFLGYQYVKDLIDGGYKFLVFGHNHVMLNALEDVVKCCKCGYIRIDGSVSSADRASRIHDFQTDATVRVAILGIQAGGVGVTLTAASTVVFAELHWTPRILMQAEDRAHRIGQKRNVTYHYLFAAGTVDNLAFDLA